MISALAQSEEVAAALVPMAVIPQIILAGVIAPLSGLGKFLADSAITARWGQQALEALLPDGDLTLLRRDRSDYPWPVAIVGIHILIFAGGTLLALWSQGRIKRSV
jgi:hypothetical protein